MADNGRVLILGPYDIRNPTSGGELRSYHLARQLSRFLEVVYLCFRRDWGGKLERQLLPGLGNQPMELWHLPRPRRYTPWKILRGWFGKTPLTLLNYSSRAMQEALRAVLDRGRFDFLHIEGVHMSGYLNEALCRSDRPLGVVADWHDVESELLYRYSRREKALPRRLYAARTVKKLRAAEISFLKRAHAHLAVSEDERRILLTFEPGAKIWVVENGVDAEYFAEALAPRQGRFRVLFVGAMDYYANTDAVLWFAQQAWPLIRQPGLVFTVVGRSPTPAVRALADGQEVEVTGTVPDVRPYYREALVQVVPLRVGGGTRLKIPESMAAGVPVVTTALGAEGLRVRPGEHCLFAETPEQFRDAIRRLVHDAELWQRLSDTARDMARREYDWSVVCAPLREIYGGLAGRLEPPAAGRPGSALAPERGSGGA